jgi:Protein of unknown function (DUF2735)
MANTTHTETATIYQFPVTSRTIRRGQPVEATVMLLEGKSNRFADAAYGSGWYHDAAIEAEDKPKS